MTLTVKSWLMNGWVPGRLIHATTSERNECLHNLKRIDGAKKEAAHGDQAVIELDENSLSKILGGKLPACPSRGKYTIGTLDQEPTCSIHPWAR
jgi:hypothetical protein